MKQKFYAKSVKVAEVTDRILQTAERIGIILPSTHTALFQSVYSPIDESNDNGVRLSKKAVDKFLPGIIGAQANLEHLGKNWMVGMILDSWINSNNEIEIIYSFAKNIFEEEYIRALEQMNNKKLAVSFELLSSPSSTEELEDGTILLHDIDFQGVGVLIDETPAYKNAITYEVANKYKARAEQDNELIFAKKIVKTCDDVLAQESQPSDIDEILWTTITTRVDRHIHVTKIDMDGNGETVGTFGDEEDDHTHKIVNYQVQEKKQHAHRLLEELLAERKAYIEKKSKDNLQENSNQAKKEKDTQTKQGGNNKMTEEQTKLVADLREEFGDHAKDVSDEQLLDEAKVEEIRKAKSDTEAKNKEDEKSELKKAQERIANLEAENAEMKATIEAKDSEIESVRENAEKIGKLKIELKDNSYVADFKDEDYLDEDKIERAKMQKENDDLKAKNEELAKEATEAKTKIKASKETKEEDLNTGHNEDEPTEDAHTVLQKHYVK